jgi:glycosyltransferase involved in cell wall biosynthesis
MMATDVTDPSLAADATTIVGPDEIPAADRPLRIAQVAPPIEPVPPTGYGGTERVVATLVEELRGRGHDVTLFASGDSTVEVRLVPTIERALRASGDVVDPWPYVVATIADVVGRAEEFDVVHVHLEWAGPLVARLAATPVVATFHGRLDQPFAGRILADPPAGLVAISRAQASAHPMVPWAGIVYNGLRFAPVRSGRAHGEDLCFVGRLAAEKGVADAIEIARRSGRRLRIAAKKPWLPSELAYFQEVFEPAMKTADVEYLGELEGSERDELFATSYATLMPGSWPEPFGLVAIESLACGTPVLARPSGALPEIIREGQDGFFGEDAATLVARLAGAASLDPGEMQRSVRERFSAGRMAAGYEAVYRKVIAEGRGSRKADPPGERAGEPGRRRTGERWTPVGPGADGPASGQSIESEVVVD